MKKLRISLIILTAISIISCQKEPVASFTVSSTTVKKGETISFTNTTEDGVDYEWDFGDGNSSTIQSPSHVYDNLGDYTVTLTAYSKNGKKSNSTSETVQVGNIYKGPKMTFSKADGADWTLASNQDRITDNVWITRADNQGIFNIAKELSYSSFLSPSGTMWAVGTTSNLNSLVFTSWEQMHNSEPPTSLNVDLVMHLVEDDIYIDIKFLSWASGGSGGQGGFSYERSTK